jgi:hypothetical protein
MLYIRYQVALFIVNDLFNLCDQDTGSNKSYKNQGGINTSKLYILLIEKMDETSTLGVEKCR